MSGRVFNRVIVCALAAPFLLGGPLLWMPQAHGAQGISPAQHAASCRNSRVSWPERAKSEKPLRFEVDVNGDGLTDVLEAESSCGSGACSTDVQLTLGGSGVKLEASEGFSFMSITTINRVPKELFDPRHRTALAWMEEALFGKVCAIADPSLAWLFDRAKRLFWIAGPPEIPHSYAIRLPARRLKGLPFRPADIVGGELDPDGEVWLSYAGHLHAGLGKRAYPVELARMGDRVLLGMAHGVILTNPKRSRHAWIYVYPGDGEVRLRHPSIGGARLEGDTAMITLNRRGGPDGSTARGAKPDSLQVRVDLTTGAILH
jgi:hypothetical protein